MTRTKLTKEDIQKIVSLFKSGIKKSHIAKQFNIDNATVHYHTKRVFFGMEKDDVREFLLRQRQGICLHTSFKCSGCGMYIDNTRRDDYERIKSLVARIDYLEGILITERIPFGK